VSAISILRHSAAVMDALLPFTPELLCEPLIVLRDSLQFSGSFMLPILTKLALQVCGADIATLLCTIFRISILSPELRAAAAYL
jgi:hypothetical protein